MFVYGLGRILSLLDLNRVQCFLCDSVFLRIVGPARFSHKPRKPILLFFLGQHGRLAHKSDKSLVHWKLLQPVFWYLVFFRQKVEVFPRLFIDFLTVLRTCLHFPPFLKPYAGFLCLRVLSKQLLRFPLFFILFITRIHSQLLISFPVGMDTRSRCVVLGPILALH